MAEQPFTVIDIDVEDDATFDTDTLVVDGTNNRVGILVAAPTVTFDVLGTSLFTGTMNVTSSLTLGTGGTAYIFPTTDGGSGEALVSDGAGNLTFTAVGAGSVTSVGITAGTGISVSGSPITSSGSMTVTNIGVTSLVAGSNIGISGSTGAVTISSTDQFVGTVTSVATSSGTFVDITGGTITTAGTITSDLSASGTAGATTFLRGDNTWSTPSGTYSSWTLSGDSGSNQTINDGDTVDIAGGTGIATVASATDTITVTNTGVTSNVAGTGISVSGATGAVTITNSGVTSIVAGTNISISGSTGAVTINSTDQFVGTVTSVDSGTGLSGGPITTSGTLNLDLDSLSASGTLVGTDDLAVVDGTTTAKTQISTIPLSIFLNDSGWTSNTGTVTSVATSSGTFVNVTGGTITGSGTITGDLSATGTASASTFLRGDNTWSAVPGGYTSWTLAGDGGTPQVVLDGNTVTIAGGTGLTTSATATDTVTIVLDDTAVTPGSYTYSSLTVDQQGRLTAASSGSSPGTMDDWILTGDTGSQTITDGDTVAVVGATGIDADVTATDTLTITNTGVTSNVAGSGISVSGATGAVTITNSGVTSIVAGTNVSISGSTGAVTINSTDQFVGTVTSVATSNGTFVDITGGTITTSGTITGDLSATGTASASTYLRGDNTWATIAGDITDVNAGTGLSGGGSSGSVTLSVDYLGTDNFIDSATDLEGTPIATADSIVYHDTGDNNVKKGLVSDLPFSSTSGTVTSVAASGGTGISISGSPITTSGTITIGNTGVTSNVAGTGISVSGATGAVTITNAGVTGVTGGEGIDTTASTGSITLTLDLDELTTTTTSTNADFFPIVNSGASQFKIAPSDIDLSTFNNDSGWTTNVGTVTSVATGSGTFVDITGGTITGSGTVSGDLSATGTASASTYLRGDNTWAAVPGGYTSWTLAGDTGANQTILDGNTATIAGGTALSTVGSATDTVTINLDNTAVSAGSYTYGSFTVDAQGRLTAASSGSSPGTMSSFSLTGDTGTPQTISDGDTVDIAGGTGLSSVAAATDTVTLSLDNTAVSAGSYTYSSITVDAQGRLTAASSGSAPGTMDDWILSADSGTPQTIADGNTVDIAGGTGISTVASATDTVTITNTGVTSAVASTGISVSGATGAVTFTNTGVTSIVAGSNISISGSTGAVTISSTDQFTGTVTSVATSNGTFVDVTGGTITTSGTITSDLSATGTASATTFLRGDNTWSTPTGDFSDFIISDGSTTQTIADGDTLLFSTGTGVTAVVSATDTLTITNTGVTSNVAGSGIGVSGATGAVTITNSGVTSIVAGTNVSISGSTGAVTISSTDQYTGTVTSVATSSGTFVDVTGGTITASGTITGDLSATGTASASTFLRGDNTWASPAGSFTFDVGGSSGPDQTISSGDKLTIAQGTGITSIASATDTVTVTLADTAVTPGSYTYSSLTVDQQGRLTSASSGSSPGTMDDFTLAGSSGPSQTISDGNTLTIAQGTGITSVASATDTVTITNTGVTSNVAGTGISVSGATGAVTIANTGVTSIVAGTNISVSGATGAVTISSTDQFVGTVTSVATSSGTFVDITGGTITTSGTITSDLSATGTASASTFLRGDNTWATPDTYAPTNASYVVIGTNPSLSNERVITAGTGISLTDGGANGNITIAATGGSYTSWTLAGDSGPSQTISDTNTATVAGGTGLSSIASATDTVTLNLDNTAVSAGSYTYASLTVDAQGRLTAASSGSAPGTMDDWILTGDSGTQTITDGNTVLIDGGTGISTAASATDTLTVTNTGVTSNVAGTGISVSGATGAVTITNSGVTTLTGTTPINVSASTGGVTISSDAYTGTTGIGYVPTGGSASTFLRGDGAWVTPGGSYAFWTLTADSGSNQNILNGNTVDIAGGTGISTVVGATDTVTLTLDNTAVSAGSYTYSSLTVDAQGRLTAASSGAAPGTMSSFDVDGSSGSTQTISNGDTLTIAQGTGITSVASATDTITITNSGVTSIVAGTNVSISGSTGAVTINSTDQYVGTVTSVATSSGTFVDITGGTFTTSGTITGDLSATGTASASTFLRGDNTWATPTGSVGGSNTEILYNDSGAQDGIPIFTYINTATSEEVILEGTSDQALMRITQLGTGDALLIEDSTNPDATPFKVNGDGNVAIGGASYGNKLQVHGDVGFTTTDFYIGGASGQFKALQGTAALPYYTTNGDTNTGMYNAAADTLGFSTAGVNAFQFGPSGQFGIGGATYGTAGQVLSSGGASAVPTWEDAATGTVTSVATSNGTFVDVSGGTITTTGTITGDLSATGTASASTFLRGDNTWATPAGGGTMSSWILAGDSGTQTISDGNTATVAGGTGLTSVAAATDTVTLNLDNTAVSAGSYTYASLTVDAQGRLTAASSGSSPGTMDDWILTGDSGTQTITDGNTVDIAGGTGISTAASATDTLTVTNTGVTSNVAGSGISVSGATGAVTITNSGVTSIVAGTNVSISGATGAVTINSTDQYSGTVTSVATSSGTFVDVTGGTITATGTITGDLSATGTASASTFLRGDNTWATPSGGGTMSSFTLAGDSGSSQTISDGNTLDIAGGTGISTVAGATDTVTITNTGVTSAVAGTGIDVSGATGAVTITTDVSDFMTNGVNNRVLTATGTDAMNAEANMTFDGSTLDVLGAARTYEGSTTIFAVATTTNLTAANDAGKYLIKSHTGVHTFNLPAASSVGEHYTIVYGPAATTTSGAVTIDAAAGDNITWYDGSASVYANTITWTPKAGSAITIICSSASSAWVAIGTDQ